MDTENEGKNKKSVSKKKVLWLAISAVSISIIIILAIFVGIKPYARNLFTEGMDAYEALESDLAIEKFTQLSKVPGFLSKYVQVGKDKLVEIETYEQAHALWSAGDYENALAAHASFSNTYELSPYLKPCREAYNTIPFDWAESAQGEDDFSKAVDVLAKATSGNFSANTQTRAKNSIPAVYVDWGEHLISDQDFDLAIAKLDTAYTTTENEDELEQTESLIRDTYKAWTDALVEQHEFGDAIGVSAQTIEWLESNDLTGVGVIDVRMAETRFAWGQYLAEQDKYEEALAQFNLGMDYNFHSITNSNIPNITSNYLNWGNSLLESGETGQSAELFGILILDYPESEATSQIPHDALDPIIDYGFSLYEQGGTQNKYAFEQAVAIYDFAIDLAGSGPRDSLAMAYYRRGLTYFSWGFEGAILNAVNDMTRAFELTSDDDLTEALENLKTEIIEKISRSTDPLGALILSAHSSNAFEELTDFPYCDEDNLCLSEELFNLSKQAIALEEDRKRVITTANTSIFDATEVRANYPAEAFFILEMTSDTVLLQKCPYTGNHYLERYRRTVTISIYDIKTGDLAAEQTFYGGYPDACPQSRYFSYLTEQEYGPNPEGDEIEKWVKNFLEKN